jgi:hypothetical protein
MILPDSLMSLLPWFTEIDKGFFRGVLRRE